MLLILSSNTLFVVGLSSLTASSIYTLWSFLLTYCEEIESTISYFRLFIPDPKWNIVLIFQGAIDYDTKDLI